MAETETEEQPTEELTAEAEQEADAAFAEGFAGASGETPPAGATAEPEPRAEVPVPQIPADKASAEPEPEPAPAPEPEPDVATFTKAERERLLALDKIVADVQTAAQRAFGKMGNLEATLRALQAATPAGQPVTVSDADFEELKADFPELASYHVKALNRVLGRMKGTGAPAAGPVLKPEDIDQRVEARLQAERQTTQVLARQELTDEIPDWEQITGPPNSDTEFRRWLATQTPDYQAMVANTWNPATLGRAIKRFQAHVETSRETMTKQVGDWEQIAGAPDSQTPYRTWLASKPAEYQKLMHDTWDPAVLAGSIRLFQAETGTTSPPKPPARAAASDVQRDRLAAAVQPKGGPAPPRPGEPTEDDAFLQGFKEGV